jgi:hypothetical protein
VIPNFGLFSFLIALFLGSLGGLFYFGIKKKWKLKSKTDKLIF